MSVISFLDAGLIALSRLAASRASTCWGAPDGTIGHLTCSQILAAVELDELAGGPLAFLPARTLISEIRRLEINHEHVVVDLSGAPEQTVALAVALSDIVVTPLLLDVSDYASFKHAVDLVRIVSGNMRRSVSHLVLLATRDQRADSATLVKVSGLLALKGLTVVPIPLCGWDDEPVSPRNDCGSEVPSQHLAFAKSLLDLVKRECSPVVPRRRVG